MYLSQRAHDRADVDRLNLEVYVAAPRRDGLLAEVLAVAARLSRFHLAKLRMITVFRVEPTTKASREFFGTWGVPSDPATLGLSDFDDSLECKKTFLN